MKGVSIPINTLVMLAVAIIVLLAAVAWFMGAFVGSATPQTLRQNFQNSCIKWATLNCRGEVPPDVCDAYKKMIGDDTFDCSDENNRKKIAKLCGCSEPFGT